MSLRGVGDPVIGFVKGLTGTKFIPPIGYVWKSKSPTSPASIFDGTTWGRIKDCAIIAAGDTYKLDATGGQSTIGLSTANLPAHTHTGTTSTNGAHTHTFSALAKGYINTNGGTVVSAEFSTSTSSNGAHSHTVTIEATGSGQSFSILNPYIVRYAWQRLA